MSTPDGALTVVFNGEIYNHADLRVEMLAAGVVFQGSSDTEVLLHCLAQWRMAGIGLLFGMFAFALYDVRADRLILARGRAGEKPLFWSQDSGVFAFASELKGLLAPPVSSVRFRLVGSISTWRTDHCPVGSASWRGVHKLPPTHILQLDCGSGEVRTTRY